MKNKLIHIVSGNYLTNRIPISLLKIDDPEEKEIIDFIANNLWYPLEHIEPYTIWCHIQNNALEVIETVQDTVS